MKLSKIVAAVVLLGLAGQAARAQVPGLPFYPTPTGTGVMVAAEYGHPGSGQTIYAARAGIGFGPFGATAVAGGYKFGTGLSTQTMYGASAAMKVFGGGMLPLSLAVQGGVGQVKVSTLLGSYTTTYIPVGLAARATIPMFPLKPFAVGYRTFGSNVLKEFRATVGADFNVFMGLGVHAAYDFGTDTNTQNGWGVGAHFNFRLPTM